VIDSFLSVLSVNWFVNDDCAGVRCGSVVSILVVRRLGSSDGDWSFDWASSLLVRLR